MGDRHTNVCAWSLLVVLDGHPRDGVVVRWRDQAGRHALERQVRVGGRAVVGTRLLAR
jgi:hypothetical protein